MENLRAIASTDLRSSEGYLHYIEGYTLLEASANYFILGKDEIYYSAYLGSPGQINRQGKMGQLLYTCAKQSGFTKWLEIGTWNGNGTTLCVLDGFRDGASKSAKLVSYESNKYLYKCAELNLAQHSAREQLQILHGRLSVGKTFPEPSSFSLDIRESGHFCKYYDEERFTFNNSAVIPCPFAPEVVILDGGEYGSRLDWESISKENLQVLFLDDILSYKNKELYFTLLKDPSWNLVDSETMGRVNGWACFTRA